VVNVRRMPIHHTLGRRLCFLYAVQLGAAALIAPQHCWRSIEVTAFISQKVCTKLFCKSQFPHKSVNLFFVFVTYRMC